jgi:uncharacterized protein YfaP (DUF2135 family)
MQVSGHFGKITFYTTKLKGKIKHKVLISIFVTFAEKHFRPDFHLVTQINVFHFWGNFVVLSVSGSKRPIFTN